MVIRGRLAAPANSSSIPWTIGQTSWVESGRLHPPGATGSRAPMSRPLLTPMEPTPSGMGTGSRSLWSVASPHPDQGVRQRLLKDPAFAVLRRLAEDKTVVVALRLQRRGGALVGHHPVVVGVFRVVGAKVILGNVGEDAQRFLLAVLDQFHRGMVVPRAERKLRPFWSVVRLLRHERAGIGDQPAEEVRTEPTGGERRGASRTAPHHGPAPGV